CLTLPRELQVIDGRLYQKPAAELENIRKNQRSAASEISGEKTFDGFCGKIYNLECTFTDLKCKKAGVKLRAGENEETLFYLDKTTNKLVLNREKSGRLYAEEYGQIRQCDFDEDHLKLQIFVDTSSIEIFVNDGLEVFTTRIYTQEESQGITFFAEGNAKLQASIWDLKL
ncbi:GH32 C-terminal domain-containing protein, partial [Anaerostipes sp.]